MKFGINYRETYEDYYVIEDPAIHTVEEAEAELIERLETAQKMDRNNAFLPHVKPNALRIFIC